MRLNARQIRELYFYPKKRKKAPSLTLDDAMEVVKLFYYTNNPKDGFNPLAHEQTK